ncbi:5135_t:CDS:2 [Paraglomus brasilianum]|uniref:5135_t:CDS:1 n=1 Tax=Paraglomus brasilianum TaxID=144538 RepID=A0A9N8VTY0_9GLOM|nr:5135_t:CDS:2 [Paraglomus brasilianum]
MSTKIHKIEKNEDLKLKIKKEMPDPSANYCSNGDSNGELSIVGIAISFVKKDIEKWSRFAAIK